VNAVSPPDYALAVAIGRPGETDAWTYVLEVHVSTGSALAINHLTRLSRAKRIGGRQGQNRLSTSRLMPRRFNVPTQSQVQGEVSAELEIILHISGIVVLRQARVMGEHRQSFAIR